MRLYHYSDTEIKDKINPKYFGSNCYTNRDRAVSNIKRSFFFTDSESPEYRFTSCDYKYIVNIAEFNQG